MSAASVCPRAGSSVASDPVYSDIINGLGAGAVGGVGNPSLSLAWLLALFLALLTLLLFLCHRV